MLMLSLGNFLVQKFKTEPAEFKPLKPEAPLLTHEGQCLSLFLENPSLVKFLDLLLLEIT